MGWDEVERRVNSSRRNSVGEDSEFESGPERGTTWLSPTEQEGDGTRSACV